MMRKIKAWLPAIFWMGLIFFLSSLPRVTVFRQPLIMFLITKTGHLLEYGILFILVYRANRVTFSLSFSKTIFLSFIFTLIYAISDEIHQLYVPTREGTIRDVFIDGLGAFVVAQFIARRKDNP